MLGEQALGEARRIRHAEVRGGDHHHQPELGEDLHRVAAGAVHGEGVDLAVSDREFVQPPEIAG